MENKVGKQLAKKVVKEVALKKAGTNCSGLMYEVKKPEVLKNKKCMGGKKS